MRTKEILTNLLLLKPAQERSKVKPGIYPYYQEMADTYTKFYLRVDRDGRGMLIANASAAARLSQSGVIIAKGVLESKTEEEIVAVLQKSFRSVAVAEMRQDVEKIAALIANLAAPGDNYPIINLDDADISPFETELIAPLRADLPVGNHAFLSPIIIKTWNAAIPHITFRMSDQNEVDDLVHSVELAEDLGMIAGVRARANDLAPEETISRLAMAGIDYITMPVISSVPVNHNEYLGEGDAAQVDLAIGEIIKNEVTPVVEIPLIRSNVSGIQNTLDWLQAKDVHSYQFFAIVAPDEMSRSETGQALSASAIAQVADTVEETASEMDVRFIWQPPVLREPRLGIDEQILRGPRCSDDFSVLLETSGDVIPARGPYESAGNILVDEWSDIWNNEAFLHFRERIERPTRCDDCPELSICAVDCPRKIKGWSQGYGDLQ